MKNKVLIYGFTGGIILYLLLQLQKKKLAKQESQPSGGGGVMGFPAMPTIDVKVTSPPSTSLSDPKEGNGVLVNEEPSDPPAPDVEPTSPTVKDDNIDVPLDNIIVPVKDPTPLPPKPKCGITGFTYYNVQMKTVFNWNNGVPTMTESILPLPDGVKSAYIPNYAEAIVGDGSGVTSETLIRTVQVPTWKYEHYCNLFIQDRLTKTPPRPLSAMDDLGSGVLASPVSQTVRRIDTDGAVGSGDGTTNTVLETSTISKTPDIRVGEYPEYMTRVL